MPKFETPASDYMSAPLRTVLPSTSGVEADRLLDKHGISAVGVVDERGALVGVLSRTDLLQTASAEAGETFRVAPEPIRTLMTPDPLTVSHDTPLSEVAAIMIDRRVHRVFVSIDGRPVGVVSTRDLMRAVLDKRVRAPVSDIATRKLIRVRPDDPIALAVERLDLANKHGLVVVEDKWPLGTFSQADALAARAHDPRTPVEDVMNLRILAIPPSLPLYRAAQQALSMNVRRILLVADAIEGVVSSFDFARVVR